MFLSDIDIKREVKGGAITIRPFDVKRLQPVSYDVTLGNEFQVTNRHGRQPARVRALLGARP
jgi:deoxycytidine triphosphate deaminase